MKHIYFVRHGETNANLEQYLPTSTEPLNDHGLMQASKVAERLENIDLDYLVASDYERAQQTAQAISVTKKLDVVTVDCFGEVKEDPAFDGLSESDERVTHSRLSRNANVNDPDWRHDAGENFHDIMARCMESKKYLSESSSNNIAVVSHALFSRFFAATILLSTEQPTEQWLQIALNLKISNTGVTLITVDDSGKWKLVVWNDHAHFAE